VKNSLRWTQYQVRNGIAIRRYWQLVCCVFTFRWRACRESLEKKPPLGATFKEATEDSPAARASETAVLAGGIIESEKRCLSNY
jgi:hypothetical protein